MLWCRPRVKVSGKLPRCTRVVKVRPDGVFSRSTCAGHLEEIRQLILLGMFWQVSVGSAGRITHGRSQEGIPTGALFGACKPSPAEFTCE
jgi:hypothetical protein